MAIFPHTPQHHVSIISPGRYKAMTSKTLLSPVLIFYVLILAASIPASPFQIPADHQTIAKSTVREILECRFDDALRIAENAYQSGDKNPMAAVMHLAALGMRDVDFDGMIDSAAFMRSFERAKGAVDRYENQHGASSYVSTLKGFVLGMHASFHLKNGSHFAAMGTGLDAIKVMKEAKELDSTNTEVNFFLGMYDYARGDLKKRVPGVLFWFPGDKKSGIRLLEEGAQGAVITKTASALALSDIYLKEKKTQQSRDIIYNLKRELPQSRFVLWAEAKYFENQKMFLQTAKAYENLSESYKKEDHGKYSMIVTGSKAAHMYEKAGVYDIATDICKDILKHGGSGDKRIDVIIKDVQKLYRRLVK
jgi:tetratricopeptide (TPR) repeat protein